MSDTAPTTFAGETEKMVTLINKYRTELKARGLTDAAIDNAIAEGRLEALLGVRFSE